MMVSLEPITIVLTSITNCCAISFLPLNYSDNYELFISIDNKLLPLGDSIYLFHLCVFMLLFVERPKYRRRSIANNTLYAMYENNLILQTVQILMEWLTTSTRSTLYALESPNAQQYIT